MANGSKPSRKIALPAFQSVQLASLVDAPPAGEGWIHEVKYDGFRILLAIGGGQARAYTRAGLDWSKRFAPIVAGARNLNAKSALIDGEAVVLDERGRSRFQLIQGAMLPKGASPVLYAFDLLSIDGVDLTGLALLERKQRLAALVGRRKSGVIRYAEHFVEPGESVFKAACKEGLEGIICKRASAPYVGARNANWLKVKCIKRQEFVVVGWTESDKNRGFRSLILAVNERGKLRYAGKVGTGFDVAEIDRLLKQMKPLKRAAASIEAPRTAVKGAHWIAPTLVAEIAFTEMTNEGILRHPSYLGLRGDKAARDVAVERPLPATRKRVPARSKRRRD